MIELNEEIFALIIVVMIFGVITIVITELLEGLLPCQAKTVIEDILNHNGYVSGYKRDKLKELLFYEYKYHRCDRYHRLLKRFKELEKDIY